MLQVIHSCDGDKAPGPDGFSMQFYKVCWETLKEDLMQTIHNFHQWGIFEKAFKPISLIGGVYKIISKLLTERLKSVIGKLVDEHQMAFLQGRQILDASLLANELVDSRNKQKKPGIYASWILQKPMIMSIGISFLKF